MIFFVIFFFSIQFIIFVIILRYINNLINYTVYYINILTCCDWFSSVLIFFGKVAPSSSDELFDSDELIGIQVSVTLQACFTTFLASGNKSSFLVTKAGRCLHNWAAASFVRTF